MMTEITQITTEFGEYREHHDLDRLFAQGFDRETRETLLSNISDLMKKTDWHTIDKYVLEEVNQREDDQT